MKNLEHNIKNAFSESDAKTTFSSKDALWNRLEDTMHKSKGVAVFWRVAAIFLGLLLVSGVFAGLIFKAEQQKTTHRLQEQNLSLQHSIDSLLAQPIKKVPEVHVVERVVYRDRLVQQNKTENAKEWNEKYQLLQDSVKMLVATNEQHYLNEIEKMQTQLAEAKNELAVLQSGKKQLQKKENELFQLKSERVELGIQKTPVMKNQEIELKIFPKNFIQNSNDLNKTLFINK